jgi:hypothetical protein
VDATSGLPVDATFTVDGAAATASCIDVSDAGTADAAETDAGAPCAAFELQPTTVGMHTIVVTAAGHVSQTLMVSIRGPSGCCGQGPTVEETVRLQ